MHINSRISIRAPFEARQAASWRLRQQERDQQKRADRTSDKQNHDRKEAESAR